MEWLGQAKKEFISPDETLSFQKKDGTSVNLLQVCKDSTPSCNLNPLLFNGHLQTMWTAIKDDGPPVYYKRKIFDAEDAAFAGTYCVDFVVPPNDETDGSLPPRTTYYSEDAFDGIASDDNKPMLIALHGLSGGSYEVYLRHVIAPLISNDGGWEACVVNSRGCAMHKITTGILYNARATWDMRQTVKWLRSKFPNRPLFAVGFSLGANILTNYVGEEGSSCELKAVLIISSPWNLEASSISLQSSYIGMEVYSKTMGSSMKALLDMHKDMILKKSTIDMDKINNIKYLHEFDREVQCQAWGYPTESAYYRDASSCDSLLAVRIPLFALNATDDPIASNEAIPYQEFKINPYTVLCTTSMGGHLSWFEVGGHRWHARPAVNFLNKMAFEIVQSTTIVAPTKSGAADEDHKQERMVFAPIRRKMHFEGRS